MHTTDKKIASHFIIWAIYIPCYIFIIKSADPDRYIPALNFVAFFGLLIGTVYASSLYIFQRFLTKKKIVYLIFSLLILCIVFIVLRYLFLYKIIPYFYPKAIVDYPTNYFIIGSIWLFIQHSFYGYGYYALRREKERNLLEKENDRLEQARLKAEQEKTQAELTALKSQFNPHLLYNTLNYFYSKVYKLDEDLAENIIKLSDILRYSLEGNPETLVALEDEVYYLHNFIELHRLRFGENAHIVFKAEGEVTNQKILPLVFISFVENAFKHGDYSQAEHPIEIKVIATENSIFFSVKNRKRKYASVGSRVVSTGIGVENVKRRLALVYKENYQLALHEDPEFYACELTLPVFTSLHQKKEILAA